MACFRTLSVSQSMSKGSLISTTFGLRPMHVLEFDQFRLKFFVRSITTFCVCVGRCQQSPHTVLCMTSSNTYVTLQTRTRRSILSAFLSYDPPALLFLVFDNLHLHVILLEHSHHHHQPPPLTPSWGGSFFSFLGSDLLTPNYP